MILTSFRQGEGNNFTPLPPRQNEPLKSPPRLGLKMFPLKLRNASLLQSDKILMNDINFIQLIV